MKRFISALALCVSLFVLLSLFLFPPVKAKENVLLKLLDLPAPAPPNPLVKGRRDRDEKFYNKNNPPNDNAPIEDLIDYWTRQAYRGPLYYSPRPSDKTLHRLAAEIAKKPELATGLLGALRDSKDAADIIKDIYDRAGTEGGADLDRSQRNELRAWLRFNSPYFSGDLERVSQRTQDVEGYVSNESENNLLALTRHDFDRANPIINRLYNDSSQPVSKALATWALYRHAVETDSLSDIEHYRSELMRMVENRSLPDGVRDKANDALTTGPDFSGREDWSLSLFEDETLVNMPRFTMLTTLMTASPPDKYIPKIIKLIEKTSNPTVRAAAVRNLAVALRSNRDLDPELNIEIIRCVLPWLEDPKWANDVDNSRGAIVGMLSEYKIPESVPGLIKILDEKETRQAPAYGANVAVNAMRAAANAVNRPNIQAANSVRDNLILKSPANGPPIISYPYRSSAISALGKQKDGRAVPVLRRVLPEIEDYERNRAVGAILDCGGYTVPEQMEALEHMAKGILRDLDTSTRNAAYPPNYGGYTNYNAKPSMPFADEIKLILGRQLMMLYEISDELARSIVRRIEELDGKDPALARAYRQMVLKWQNSVINILLLNDVKRDASDVDTILRLLTQRKELREKQPTDVFDLQTGKPLAVGIAACLLDEPADYVTILENADAETKTAMLACARLIRAPLPVQTVSDNLKSLNQILQIAAERYLEAEDSPEARAIVLARHPNEAKILGSTTAFFVEGTQTAYSQYLSWLHYSVNEKWLGGGLRGGDNEELKNTEKSLQDEVKKDGELVGIYAYDSNYIRIYKDRVIFSWDEDESRYRERPLTREEFEEIKTYLTTNKVDELAPFLYNCGGPHSGCLSKELVMLGRNGGRRVYLNREYSSRGTNPDGDFFAGLDKYFADLKKTRATLKYFLSREIPGLEIVLASDDLHADTVWVVENDVRVAASDVSLRKKIKAEIENFDDEIDTADENIVTETYAKRNALIEKRRYDGYAWYKVADGDSAGIAAQPEQVEFIPLRDTLAVRSTDEQWKARGTGFELRASKDGLYRVAGGKLTRLLKGDYEYPVVTANGRWAVVTKNNDEEGPQLVRVDLATSREYPVTIESYGEWYASAFVATLNKVLVARTHEYYDGEYASEDDDRTPADAEADDLLLLDPATGVTQPITGEFRPLDQQTFRALQKASKPNEFWAAIHDPEKNETQVGIYDTKVFGFKPVLRIPKIDFNSMSMWVDEAAGKVYFVYRGHLLALPLAKQ